MLKPSDFNNAVPKFQNGTYANNPLAPTDIEEPSMEDYVRGVEPLDTLPAQWWNWLCNQFTSRFNKINTYVKNVFDELTQLLSLVGVTPDGTEGTITTGQLKNAFEQRYPNFLSKFIHTIAQIWSYTGSSTSGSVTTTQASRLAVFEKVTASDSSTSPATVTETYNTKYVDTLPVRLGGTGANTKQGALANLTCELTTPEVLPQDADVIINNNGVVQKTSVSSIVSYAGTVSIENSTANCAIPVALCTGFTNVGKSNCCPLTYNPAIGALIAGNSIGVYDTGACGAQSLICKLVDFPTYCQWVLLHDITDWYNCNAGAPTQFMTGRFYIGRRAGSIESTILDAVMAHSCGRAGTSLQCNTVRQRFLYNILPGLTNWVSVKPVIICENATGKVYTALRKVFTDNATLSYSGDNYGTIINCLVPGGGQNVTIPSGWTHLYEAPLGGIVSCANKLMYSSDDSFCCCSAMVNLSNTCYCGLNSGFYTTLAIRGNLAGTMLAIPTDPSVNKHMCFQQYNNGFCGWNELIDDKGGQTINGKLNVTCLNASCCISTSCVCASQYIYTPTVSAPDPGSTASKQCNLTLQAFCTNASCVKSTQQIVFNGATGQLCWNIKNNNDFYKSITTECYGLMPNTISINNGGLYSYIHHMTFCPTCAVCDLRAGFSCFINYGVIGTMILNGDLCPVSFIACNSNVYSFYKPTSTSPFKTLCVTATSTLSTNCISALKLMSLS